jgi:glycosyltransferase involved in cell wall biosynthesis
MSTPALSVTAFVAVRDGGRYLRSSLDSVLDQTRPPDEVVVVDDGSTDDTADILASYGSALRVFRTEPSGYPAAVNRGIAEARCAVIGCLDADDYWALDAVERRLDRLRAPDAPDAVAGRMTQFLSPDLEGTDGRRFRFDPGPTAVTLFQTTLIRREAFVRVGPLDPTLPTSANVDWLSRARAAGMTVATIDDVVAHRRIHRSNMGIRLAEQKHADLIRIVRAHHGRTRLGERETPER